VPSETERVAPQPTPLTEGYWSAAQRGQLHLQRCGGDCRRFIHLPEPACPTCGSTRLAHEPVSGHGTVHTFSIVHRTFAPGFAGRTPYPIAWIDLPEQDGLRVFANVLGCEPEEVHIGQAVEVCFEELPGFGLVPNFRAS